MLIDIGNNHIWEELFSPRKLSVLLTLNFRVVLQKQTQAEPFGKATSNKIVDAVFFCT